MRFLSALLLLLPSLALAAEPAGHRVLAAHVRLFRYRKSTRGPKSPFQNGVNLSTLRLLNEQKDKTP